MNKTLSRNLNKIFPKNLGCKVSSTKVRLRLFFHNFKLLNKRKFPMDYEGEILYTNNFILANSLFSIRVSGL